MSRIEIKDLPVVEAIDDAEAALAHGGASYRYIPRYGYNPVYRPPVPYYNPGNFYRPNPLISHNRGW